VAGVVPLSGDERRLDLTMKNSKDRGRSQVKPKGPRSARPKAPLHNPVAIAEDQADLLIAGARVQEGPMKTLDQYLVERGP
jgi:hypothetical protein